MITKCGNHTHKQYLVHVLMADGQKLLMVVDGDETPIMADGISQATSSSIVQRPALSAATSAALSQAHQELFSDVFAIISILWLPWCILCAARTTSECARFIWII